MYDAFMTMKAAKLGKIEGSTFNKSKAGWIDILDFEHQLTSPRDPSTGQAAGKVKFGLVKVKKPIDKATPLLYQALATNDLIQEVLFEFYTSGATAAGRKYLDIKLTNAFVAEVTMYQQDIEMGKAGDRGEIGTKFVQTVALSYYQMSWKYQGYNMKGEAEGGPKESQVQWAEV